MTRTVGVHEAKTHLSRLLEQVADGDEVLITNRGAVVARLVAPSPLQPRLGFDRAVVVADDFDAPLPVELQAGFDG